MTIVVARDPLPSSVDAEADGDARLTADRDERKYLVPYDELAPLSTELTRRLASHRFKGEGANRLPDPHHYVTTVYFDTPSRKYYLAARERGADDLKLRAKAYYDLHPSLAELATDASQIVHAPSILWFEIKRRSGSHTSKRRFPLRQLDVPAFFAERRVAPGSLALARPGSPEAEAREEALDHFGGEGEPLSAACIVNYRRLSWQDERGALRVTVDLGLSYYSVPADVWTRAHGLERSMLGIAAAREPRAVLEVKRTGGLPEWLVAVLAGAKLRDVPFSKFVAAAEAVHARR